MSHCHANATQPLQEAAIYSLKLNSLPPIAIELLLISLSSAALAWLLLPRVSNLIESPLSPKGNMSLALVGAFIFALCAMAYVLGIGAGTDEGLLDPKKFQGRKDLYRTRRDNFRSNPEAMEELKQWKAMSNNCDYKIL